MGKLFKAGSLGWGVVAIILMGGLAFGFLRANNINSISDLKSYAQEFGKKFDNCLGGEEAKWTCENPDVKLPSGDSSGSKGDSGGKEAGKDATGSPASSAASALKKLETIKVGNAVSVEYKRSDWKHWTGSPCDTRKKVLIAQGKDVTKDASTCRITSGTWTDWYSGETVTDASKLDIDHVIPLGYAAKHGGNGWDTKKKEQFANDTTQLLAVGASENRSKSDKGPKDYMPKDRSFRCEYSKLWVSTASKYGITLEKGDVDTLSRALKSCD